MKHLKFIIISLVLIVLVPVATNAQSITVQGALNNNTPPARSIDAGAQLADLAWIDITATSGDLQLQGFQLGTDVAGGLNNFSEIRLYDASAPSTTIADYSSLSTPGGDTANFSGSITNITISQGQVKTFILRGSLASSAAGTVRVGIQDLVLVNNTDTASKVNIPIYGNAITLPGATPTPTPSATPTPTPSVTPTPSPTASPTPTATPTPALHAPSDYGLHEGDMISASGSNDPDVYIVNQAGYKRLFLNPVIFGFYGQLTGGFAAIKHVAATTRDAFPTSGLFRDCQVGSANNNGNVYVVQVTGEDTATLHHVALTGDQAVAQDANFFNKVFCINDNEFNWYTKSSIDYTALSQIPVYSR